MKVSVIVPMYNVAGYIQQCMESLEAQTLKDMEVILVNDGSTDETPQLAEAFAARFPERFRVLHKKNGGLSDARNYAIPYAQGEYLAFLDSDDFAEPQLYERMVAKAEEENADLCVCDIEYYYEDPSRRYIMKGMSDWPAETIQKRMMLSPMFAWNKLYRRSLFETYGFRYPLQTWYEDIPVSTMVFVRAGHIAYVPEAMIHYRQREGSIMSDVSSPRVKEIFGVMELVRDNFEKAGLDQEYRTELEYLHIEHLRLYGMFRFIRSASWKELYEESEAVMLACFPNWKRNPYLKNLGIKNRVFLMCYSKLTSGLFHRMIRK